MTSLLVTGLAATLSLIAFHRFVLTPIVFSPLSRIPGPKSYALTKWRLAYDDWNGTRTRRIHRLHLKYGSAVRVGPNEVHFNSPTALRTIYGAGSGFERTDFYRMFERTDFYRMFEVYGKQNVFTFGPSQAHAQRKKLLAHAYSKSNMTRGRNAREVESKIADYLDLIETTQSQGNEIFRSLHWFSLDNITNFLYGPRHGGTSALKGDQADQRLIDDILDPSRRRLSWFAVHLPDLTKWLYTRTGLMGKLVSPLLPMKKPATYTGIRAHGLKVVQDYISAAQSDKTAANGTEDCLLKSLWAHHEGNKSGGLNDLELASELSDHFLAGIDTTSDTLMFLIWALSMPGNRRYQDRIIEEARSIPESGLNQNGDPTVEAADGLPYLDAVIKESLRLYTPLPAAEPRLSRQEVAIDGYRIPPYTVVSMSPYSLHRNPEVFPEPLKFDPDRWLESAEHVSKMKKWWWAFSSGSRMCIGLHLALAEMTLVPAIYRRYSTRIKPGLENVSPGITSRFEVFYDETCTKMEEHNCWIEFDDLEI